MASDIRNFWLVKSLTDINTWFIFRKDKGSKEVKVMLSKQGYIIYSSAYLTKFEKMDLKARHKRLQPA